MKHKQTSFFATNNDILNIAVKIEALFQIEYIEMGAFDFNKKIKYNSLSVVPNIGYTNFGNWISLDNRFMIIKKGSDFNMREVPQRNGGMKYVVDFMINPMAVELSTGGVYLAKENVLIAGRLACIDDNEFSSQVYNGLLKGLRKEFRKIQGIFVGIDAEKKLRLGWRLVTSEKSPKEYDLKI